LGIGERAKAAEERGDSQSAIERYEWLLKKKPEHVDARTRLAELLARTGKFHRATQVLDDGLGLPGVEGRMLAKWRELKERIEDGTFGDARPEGERPTFKALADVRHARLEELRKDPAAGRDDEGPLAGC